MLKEITVVTEYLITFYLLQPLLLEFIKRGVYVHLICRKDHEEFIRSSLPNFNGEIIYFEDLRKAHYAKFIIHRFVATMLTSPHFSPFYNRKIKVNIDSNPLFYGPIYFISGLFPKAPINRVNRIINKLLSRFVRSVFPTKRIVAGTFSRIPELLCSNDASVVTVMESWDHPLKMPTGYTSDLVFTWNHNIAEDWRKFQGDENVVPIYPLKLRYALETVQAKVVDPNSDSSGGTKPICIYCVAFTSHFPGMRSRFIEENGIIEELCEATKKAGWRLHLKPRPHGCLSDFQNFPQKYDHVSVGYMKAGAEMSQDYYLDDEYNFTRFSELENCSLVINAITTFGLDAAAAGYPVLQLDLSQIIKYPEISAFCANYHIKNYLLKDLDCILRINSSSSLSDDIAKYLSNRTGLEYTYSHKLREWLLSAGMSYNDAIQTMADNILAK